MGIKGTVRRATDGHVIHANVDTDVIVSEEPPLGSTEKPEQMYSIIERFCLGRRYAVNQTVNTACRFHSCGNMNWMNCGYFQIHSLVEIEFSSVRLR